MNLIPARESQWLGLGGDKQPERAGGRGQGAGLILTSSRISVEQLTSRDGEGEGTAPAPNSLSAAASLVTISYSKGQGAEQCP